MWCDKSVKSVSSSSVNCNTCCFWEPIKHLNSCTQAELSRFYKEVHGYLEGPDFLMDIKMLFRDVQVTSLHHRLGWLIHRKMREDFLLEIKKTTEVRNAPDL